MAPLLEAPREEDEADLSDGSSLSSGASSALGRQVTEFSEAVCLDVFEREVSDFQNRQGDYWAREMSCPVGRQGVEWGNELRRRQVSCPETMCMSMTKPAPAPIAEDSLEEGNDVTILETAICKAVSMCNFAVSVADPCTLDNELIAVSEGFVRLTGYEREDAVGKNCRFLNEGCEMSPETRARLKLAAEEGVTCVTTVENRRKTSQVFQNLVDIRGLVIARHTQTDDEIWVAIAVQMDVTNTDQKSRPEHHLLIQTQVASRIRKQLFKSINLLGLGGSLLEFKLKESNSGSRGGLFSSREGSEQGGSWYLVPDCVWRGGASTQIVAGVKETKDSVPGPGKSFAPPTQAALAALAAAAAAPLAATLPQPGTGNPFQAVASQAIPVDVDGKKVSSDSAGDRLVAKAAGAVSSGSKEFCSLSATHWFVISGMALALGAFFFRQRTVKAKTP